MGEKPESFLRERFPKGEVISLWDLSASEIDFLRERTEKSGGLIRIFVHPYYEKHIKKEDYDRRIKAIHDAIAFMGSIDSEKTPPIFIMEEYDRLEDLAEKLGDGKTLKNNLYVIRTYGSVSEPYVPHAIDKRPSHGIEEFHWKVLIEKLQEIGVKKILVGGMYLQIDIERERTGELKSVPCMCVGGAIRNLSGNFEVEISNLAFPHGRKEFLAAQEEVKKSKHELQKT